MNSQEISNSINISIIIPVYNDVFGIKQCLDAISHQTQKLDNINVIVVDNNSDYSPKEVIQEFPFAHYAFEKKAGSYAARNKGMSLAKGEYLVFLDADCVPEPDWLEQGIMALDNAKKDSIVGGHIAFTLSNKPTIIERYQFIVGFQQKENIEDKYFSATANLFIKKEDALKIGLFEERLLSGGDRNWCWRGIELGMEVIYCPNSIVTTKPRRLLKNAIKQTRRVAGGRFHSQVLGLSDNPIIQNRQKPHRSNWQSIMWIFQHTKLSYIQRIQVFFIAVLLKIVAMVEKWRLKLGAKAERY